MNAQRLTRRAGPWWILAVLLVLGGCRGRRTEAPDAGDPAAVAAKLRSHLRRHPEDDVAWRKLALVEWIHLHGTRHAAPIFERLAKKGDPVARLARVIAADARLDYATVQAEGFALVEQAAATGPDDPADAFLDAAAELAARRVAEHHGRQPGDDERFEAFFDRLSRAALPVQVRQPLVSERAAIARRRGKEYRRFYAEEGCVQDWTVGAVTGHQGAPDLAATKPGAITADPSATLAKLACVVRVWNPAAAPGVRSMRAALEVKGDRLELELGAQHAARFWLDGKLLLRTDITSRHPAGRTRFEIDVEPGVHVLEVATEIPDERGWVLARATEPGGAPVVVRAEVPSSHAALQGEPRRITTPWPDALEPLEGSLAAPLRALLAVEDAIADGDADRAERHMAEIGKKGVFSEGHVTRAAVWRLDASRGGTVADARERRDLRLALKGAPDLDAARLRLFELQLSRGEEDAVAEQLAKLPRGRLRQVQGELLRYRVEQARGGEFQAEKALARAEAKNPGGCHVLLARRAVARARDDVKSEDAIARSLVPCAGSLELRAVLAERRGHLEDAVSLWAEQLERVPDDIDALEALARLHALLGDHATAKEHLRAILRLNPFRVGGHIALADLEASVGRVDAAREHMAAALQQIPYASALWEAAATLGLPDDLQQFRVDGLAALRDYQAAGQTYEGVTEVLVLDRSAVRVYPGGGQRQIVHLVVHLLSKEALDRYGELDVPEGGQLLTIHSIKPDGTSLEPELIPGKDGLSLRHLEIGDFVEYEFVVDKPPSGQLPGYVDVSTFRFQSLDVPYHRSELEVVAPAGMNLQSDRRNDAPAEVKKELEIGGERLVSRTWQANRVPRLGVEPGHRPLLEEVPSVHVYTPLHTEDWLLSLGGRIRLAQRTNPELRRKVATLTRGKSTPRAELEALWSWVVENIEPGGDLTVSATTTLAEKRGNRLLLLRAMLQEAEIESELWIARDGYGARTVKGGHPLVELYDAPMLAVTLEPGADPLMVTTASNVMPLGYLAPGYRGAAALRLPLSGARAQAATVTLPPPPPSTLDRRSWDLVVDLDETGSGRVEGTIELQGMEAVRWRQALREIDRDRIEEVFQEAELGWLRGATLEELTIDGEHELASPLRLHFTAATAGMGVQQAGAVVLRAAPMPLSVGPMYATLPKRSTGLVMPYAPEHRARIVYHLSGAKFVDVPKGANIDSPWGSFSRKVVGGGVGEGEVSLELHSTLKTGVVEPGRYGELASFAREVETVEQAVLRLQ